MCRRYFESSVVVLIVLTLLAHGGSAETDAERAALVNMFNTLGGPSWLVKEGWSDTSDGPAEPPCSWFGIFCNSSGTVIDIQLRRNNLQGSVSGLQLLALEGLETLDLSYNSVSGELHSSVLSLPAIRRIQMSRNSMTSLPPSLIMGNFSATLTQVYLERNAFECPLPRWSDLPRRTMSVWQDANSTECVATKTSSLEVSITRVAEAPVPTLPADIAALGVPSILVETHLATTNATVNLFMVVLGRIVALEDASVTVLVANETALPFLTVVVSGANELLIVFTDRASDALRLSILARMKYDHPSVLALRVRTAVSTAGTRLPSAPPATVETDDGGLGQTTLALLGVGIAALVVIVAVVAVWCLCFRRKKAFTHVQPLPGPPQKVTLTTSKSLRIDPSRGQSMSLGARGAAAV